MKKSILKISNSQNTKLCEMMAHDGLELGAREQARRVGYTGKGEYTIRLFNCVDFNNPTVKQSLSHVKTAKECGERERSFVCDADELHKAIEEKNIKKVTIKRLVACAIEVSYNCYKQFMTDEPKSEEDRLVPVTGMVEVLGCGRAQPSP